MRKLIAALGAALALGAVPLLGYASDVPDGDDCAKSGSGPTVITFFNGSTEIDRGAVCYSDGNSANGAELYAGGEVQAEEEPGAGGTCGAVIVSGQPIAGSADWDNTGPDGTRGTEDDHHCD